MRVILKTTIRSIVFVYKTTIYGLRLRRVSRWYSQEDVPYFTQWESRELIPKILKGAVRAEDDPKWRDSGAQSKVEYAAWSWNACGMACLKMILAHRNGIVIPFVTLAKECTSDGGYEMPLETSKGLKYVPFVRYLDQRFRIDAKAVSIMPLQQMVYELARGNYVMASVSSMISNPRSKPRDRGGHLVLVLGYDLNKQQVYFHNPSRGSFGTGEHEAISFKDFKRFFGKRGVVVSGQNIPIGSK